MKSVNKTLVSLIIALSMTIALGATYAFFFVAMKNKTEATAELLAKSAELSGEESRLAVATATLNREQENIERLSSYFIRENEIVLFAKRLEDLGRQSSTTVSIESLDPGVQEKTTAFLGFRLKATGTFENIQRLMVLLENMPGKFEWKTVRLTRETPVGEQVGTTTAKTVLRRPEWSVDVFLHALNFVKG